MFGKIPLAAGWRVTWSELELPYGELSGDSREVQEAMVKHGRTSANSNALHYMWDSGVGPAPPYSLKPPQAITCWIADPLPSQRSLPHPRVFLA